MVEGEEGDSAAIFYHWRELPEIPFLSRLKFFFFFFFIQVV